jgi:hypothetical protein
MTTFDKREEAFEKKFAVEEELRFKAEARRNKLLGLWAASLLGRSGEAAAAYAKDLVAADLDEPDGGALRKVTGDLDAAGVAMPPELLRTKIDELTAQAILQVKTGK